MDWASAFSAGNTRLDATLALTGPGSSPTMLVCLKAGLSYQATVNGRKVTCTQVVPGALQVTIPASAGGPARLSIAPVTEAR